MYLRLILGLVLLCSGQLFAQDMQKLTAQSLTFQIEQDLLYVSKKKSPLTKKERKAFEGHSYFKLDTTFMVMADFERLNSKDTMEMATVRGETKFYVPYAKLTFNLNGELHSLTAYQSLKLREIDEYKNYLFVPFKDATSGKTSYGGGRYLDIEIPEGDQIVLNFNVAYNPYCAYTAGYNCSIPPAENTLAVAVKAGMMAPKSSLH